MYSVGIKIIIEDEAVVGAETKKEALKIAQEEYLDEKVRLRDLDPEFIMYNVEKMK